MAVDKKSEKRSRFLFLYVAYTYSCLFNLDVGNYYLIEILSPFKM
jgi:hypothetical protein